MTTEKIWRCRGCGLVLELKSPAKRESPVCLLRPPTATLPDSEDSSRCTSAPATLKPSDDYVDEHMEENPKNPKVVCVTTRLHEGQQADKPYAIRPSQVVIPAKSNACINVTFTPHPTEVVAQTMDCVGYAFGYMSLTKQVQEGEHVRRATGYAVTPLRLEMTAQIKPALLSIECSDTEDAECSLSLRYHAATSDLMTGPPQDRELAADCVKLHSATLSNHTQTPLDFRLLSTEPFYMVEVKEGRPVSQLLQTDWCRLQPRENVLVSVGFRVSLELLEFLETGGSAPSSYAQLETLDKERKLHFRNNLLVEFNNGSVQKLALHASLVIPSLELSRYFLDFSTCLVGQQREMQIILSNPTASHSFYTITLESKSDTCSESTFAISPNEGFLEAQINNLADNKCLLHVYFNAKHSEDYECTFVVHGMLGEEAQRLTLRGRGSYDGRHEALVNV